MDDAAIRTPSTAERPTGHYDALVVGARAAGAATAMLLARRGLRVLAVERSAYGSDTLSSHALMRGAVVRLRRWGVLDRVWRAGTPVITQVSFRYGEAVWDLDVPAEEGLAGLAAPRRTLLDRLLVDAAQESGADVRHRTRLRDLVTDAHGRVRGAQLELADGTAAVVSSDLVIGADGLRSSVARQVGAPITRCGAHASAYVLRYVAGLDIPTDVYRWSYGPGVGAGAVPTNDRTWCVFAAMPPDRFARERNDPRRLMEDVLRQADPELAARFAEAAPVGPLRTWPGVRGRFRRPHGAGWALVGDAGYFKDPFAAHGITDAFRDAELLTDAVVRGDLGGYEARRDELSLPLFTVLDRIASYDWTLETLPPLHLDLARAMRDEERAAADHQPTPT
jgi:flavin-dependent dehydrogenase